MNITECFLNFLLFSTLERKTDYMTCFPIIKCCEKNKKDISQSGYRSEEKTGKIKKT